VCSELDLIAANCSSRGTFGVDAVQLPYSDLLEPEPITALDGLLAQAIRASIPLPLSGTGSRPQMRGPVMRIAPKPRRWTWMSPPILNEPDLRASSLALIAHLVDWP
jgi:hypothetical protein